MVIRVSDKTQNYSKVTKLLVKPIFFNFFVYIIGMRFRGLLIFEQNVLTIHF